MRLLRLRQRKEKHTTETLTNFSGIARTAVLDRSTEPDSKTKCQ